MPASPLFHLEEPPPASGGHHEVDPFELPGLLASYLLALFLLPFPYWIQHELVLNKHTANQFIGVKCAYYYLPSKIPFIRKDIHNRPPVHGFSSLTFTTKQQLTLLTQSV